MIARVYAAINAIAGALAADGVAKTRLNSRDHYMYRSIDDVLARLALLLAQHRLCILPRMLERSAIERQAEDGSVLIAVALRAAFDLVSAEDGSCHTTEAYGEALDGGDKATAKAMQSAYKYAVLQAFCVPAAGIEDADATSHRLRAAPLPAEPAEGWGHWCDAIKSRIAECASPEVLRQLQDDSRMTLAALSREMPGLYRELGHAIAQRKAELFTKVQHASEAAARDRSVGLQADGDGGVVGDAGEACSAGAGATLGADTAASSAKSPVNTPKRPRASRQALKPQAVVAPPAKRGSQANGSGAHG